MMWLLAVAALVAAYVNDVTDMAVVLGLLTIAAAVRPRSGVSLRDRLRAAIEQQHARRLARDLARDGYKMSEPPIDY